MKEQTMNMLTIGLAVVVIGLLIWAIMKARKAAAEKKKSAENQDKPQPKEYFRYAEDPETCSTLTNQYCMMMKDEKINPLYQPAQDILAQLKKSCGGNSYMNISNCYPSSSTIEGGTHNANLYPMVATVVNPRYSN